MSIKNTREPGNKRKKTAVDDLVKEIKKEFNELKIKIPNKFIKIENHDIFVKIEFLHSCSNWVSVSIYPLNDVGKHETRCYVWGKGTEYYQFFDNVSQAVNSILVFVVGKEATAKIDELEEFIKLVGRNE